MEYQTILFKKNPVLFKDETEALNALRSMKFTMGEPVIALYGPSWKDAELILAVGKRTAAGESAFDVIATSKDTDNISIDISNIENNLSKHENTLANDNTPGHALSGRYIGFTNGYGYVKQLPYKITFKSGSNSVTFDGSSNVDIDFPFPGSSEPRPASGIGSPGSALNYSREDHVHPAQTTISGNAGSATKLQTARNINITGAVTGNTSTDFSGNVTINTSVNHTHPVDSLDGIQNIWDAINLKANNESPGLTGIPTAPTADLGTSTDQIATTEFVINEIHDKIEATTPIKYKGTIGTGGTISELPATHTVGDLYACISSVIVNGITLESGDMILCIKSGTSANDSDWITLQGNLVNNIIIGEGLTGNGNLRTGASIRHQVKPSEGTEQGGDNSFVTGISIDSLGHIAKVTKSNITGNVTAGANQYISSVRLNGTEIVGETSNIPGISITNGNSADNQYITGLNISDDNSHNIVVTKRSLIIPEIDISYGPDVPGQYISSLTSSGGHNITVVRSNFPEESGKVKVEEDGTADYLKNKLDTGNTSGNSYGVNYSVNSDKLLLSVEIPSIDGNLDQIIKLKRTNVPDQSPDSLGDGEIFVNTSDLYLYIGAGDEVKRLYPDATQEHSGLMSAADKRKLDQATEDIGDVGNISLIISGIKEDMNTGFDDVNNSINELITRISYEETARANEDTNIKSSITSLDNRVVKTIQLGSGEYQSTVTPVSGTAILPIVSETRNGLMSPEIYNEIYKNIPEMIENSGSSINNHTVNNILITENPVITGANTYVTGYSKQTSGAISPADTVNIALGKLETRLEEEALTRSSDDDFLRSSINSEVLTREQDDNELRSLINQEVSSIKASINIVQNNLDSESQYRLNADNTIQRYLDQEIADRTNADNDLTTSINLETQNRISGDNSLQLQINNLLTGDGLSGSLGDTHYIQSSSNLINALKALDSKLYEIEQSMLSSVLVKAAN